MDKELLRNKVVREVIALIAGGSYNSQRRLPAERQLCRQFAVSRGTIRQALSDLQELGLIEIRPGSGAYLRYSGKARIPQQYLPNNFKNISLEDVITARKAIELTAIEPACRSITRGELGKLKKLIDSMAASAGDLPAQLRYDMNFHQALVQASGNAALVTAFEAIYEYHRFSQVFSSQQEGQDKVALDYHRRILQAVSARDVKLSRNLLAQHLDSLKQTNKTPVRDVG